MRKLFRMILGMVLVSVGVPEVSGAEVRNNSQFPDRVLADYGALLRRTLDDEGSNGVERRVKACYRQAERTVELLRECLLFDKAAKILEDAYLRMMVQRFGSVPEHDNMWRHDRYDARMKRAAIKAFGSESAAQAYMGNAGELVFFIAMDAASNEQP